MSRLRAQGEERVSLGACRCEGTPHEEDEAWLSASLDPFDAAEATYLVYSGETAAALERDITFILLRGLRRWNLLDDDGSPLSTDRLRELDWATVSRLGTAASNLYTKELMAPFPEALQKSSQRGQTEASTSPTPASTQESP